MMSSETRRPSAFEPIVFTSRFISCSRKSSLRPHGSGAVGQRDPVREVAAEPRDLLADVRPRRRTSTISCATGVSSACSSARSSRTRSCSRARIAATPRRPPPRRARRDRRRSARRAVEIGAQVIAFARRASCRDRSSAASTAASTRAASCARRLRRSSSWPLADRQRLRQAAAGRPASARRSTSPRSRACSSAAASASTNASLNSTSTRRRLPQLHATAELDAAARHALLRPARAAAASIAASDCGTRSCRSRKRWFTARIVTAIVARSSSRVSDAKPVMLLIMSTERDHARLAACRAASGASSSCSCIERRVGAAGPRQQLVVAADLDDPAALEHDDRVGAADRRQPVRDDERRAVQHQVRQRLLHQQLRLGVERRRRLVEHQDRRVLQQRARDRQPLPLAARQPLPALADHRLVAAPAASTMNSCACAARAAASISLARRVRRAVGDVAARSVSSNSTVSCVTMPICARSDASVTSRMSTPSIRMRAGADVVEPRQQVDQRRLAGAAAADDRDHLPGAHRERHAAQDPSRRRRRSRSRRRGTRSRCGTAAAAARRALRAPRCACRASRRCAPTRRSPAAGSR